MDYIDISYIKARIRERILVELTSDNPEDDVIDEDKLESAINQAELECKNKLRKLYIIPFEISTAGSEAYEESLMVVKRIIVNLTMFHLYEWSGNEIPEQFISAWNELEEISTGATKLNGFKMNSLMSIASNKSSESKIYSESVLSTY